MFLTLFFCMSAAIQGSEESSVKAETRNGSDYTVKAESESEKSVEVTPGSSGDVTEDDLLGRSEDEDGEIFSDCSTHTLIQETFSDMDKDFDPELPTEFGKIEQATPAKDVVIEKEIDDGKSEKKVTALVMKDSTESTEASKPTAKPEIVTPTIPKEETEIRLHNEKFLADLGRITMLAKKDFKGSGHLKSGRYYLPEAPLLTMEGRKSGLLANLTMMESVYPCGATYQRCYSEMPIIKCRSKGIDDLGALRIQYWDNSSLFMKSGYPVGVIIPTETEIEWLITPSEDEKTIVDLASSSEHNQYCSVITIRNPCQFI